MRSTFSLRRRNYYPWLFILLVVVVNTAIFLLLRDKASHEIFLSATGAVAALIHFLYSQHNHNTERFMGLFRDFNARYDLLNNRLNALMNKDGALLLTYEDIQLLYDYFNLCAEEYLYSKSGYVDSEVWLSWLKGMKYFASNREVRKIWQEEINSGSYYGFTLALIDEVR
jgi:hypothetical protein